MHGTIPCSSIHGMMLWPSTRYAMKSLYWLKLTNHNQKYHSIHKSGKRLEDVLSEAELKELRE